MRLTEPDSGVVDAARTVLEGARTILTPDPAAAALLRRDGCDVTMAELPVNGGSFDAVALVADELSTAGEHAAGLLDAAVSSVRPGGWIVASARGAVVPAPRGLRTYTADELSRAVGHHGISVAAVWAPGAGAIVRGEADRVFDPQVDRMPGLLDAAPRLVVAGRAPRSTGERGTVFFDTLPYKVVAASVLCRNSDGRLLIVHDSFKQQWTLPGGVVDADEDPRSGAVREAWEEAGVRVSAGAVLGVFSASWPDRVVLVYSAALVAGAEHRHRPVHAHEIDGVAWVALDEALGQLAPHVAEQVRFCLSDPGGTLRQQRA